MKQLGKLKIFLMLIITTCMWNCICAQQRIVSGKITDSNNGDPLAGVNIVVEGTQAGTLSDKNGNYQISVLNGNTILVYSSVGYATRKITMGNQTTINVSMEKSAQALEAVLVVGYGTQKKEDLTGAVSVVTSKDIENRPIIDAGEALQGKAAGVQVTSNSGKPAAGLSIRIRGSSSIRAGNDPLYIVDGIPTTDI